MTDTPNPNLSFVQSIANATVRRYLRLDIVRSHCPVRPDGLVELLNTAAKNGDKRTKRIAGCLARCLKRNNTEATLEMADAEDIRVLDRLIDELYEATFAKD
jgi:hypothetical protein